MKFYINWRCMQINITRHILVCRLHPRLSKLTHKLKQTHECYSLPDHSTAAKFSPRPTVTARTGLPTTVVTEVLVLSTSSVTFVIGKNTPVSQTVKNIPVLLRSVMDWKREAGRKAAAVTFSLRVLMLVLFV